MRTIQTMFFLLIIGCVSKSDENKVVKIEKRIFDLNIPEQKTEFDLWVSKNIIEVPNDTTSKKYESTKELKFREGKFGSVKCSFEDSNFEVYSNCGGEFGGSFYFVDKKSPDKIYYLSITCPKMIDFQNGKYFLTQTLAHMSGSAGVGVLSDPRILPIISKENIFTDEPFVSESTIETILDTFGLTANVFYPYKGKAFLVYSENDTTYLGEISDRKIINREPILNHGTWSYYDELNRIKNGIYISDINHVSTSIDRDLETTEAVTGAIYFKRDTIVLGYKYNKTITKSE